MASTNWLRHEMFEKLSPQLQEWVRELDYWGYGRRNNPHVYIEERLGIGRKRTIPKATEGRYTLPGTDFQFHVYASGTRPSRSARRRSLGITGRKRVFAICPECGKEVEAGHVSQHAFKHVPKGDVGQLATEVQALLK
jgi:hypothetical protein